MDGQSGLKPQTEQNNTQYLDLHLTLFHKPKTLLLWEIELLLVLFTETPSDSLLTGIKQLKSKTDNKS